MPGPVRRAGSCSSSGSRARSGRRRHRRRRGSRGPASVWRGWGGEEREIRLGCELGGEALRLASTDQPRERLVGQHVVGEAELGLPGLDPPPAPLSADFLRRRRHRYRCRSSTCRPSAHDALSQPFAGTSGVFGPENGISGPKNGTSERSPFVFRAGRDAGLLDGSDSTPNRVGASAYRPQCLHTNTT
jgi:hypothetical protein